jgi:peptidoglycan/xylan/chitin deacetylase (PgdA/CDA1 family)
MSLTTSRIRVWARQCVWSSLYAIRSLVRPESNHCLVLTYHRVTNEVEWPDPLVVSPDQFACHIGFLKKRLQLLSAREVAEIIRTRKPFPAGSCLITFDDGWKDNYTQAFPILKSYQAPAIIFLTTDYIGTNTIFWHERLARILYSLPYTPKEYRQAASSSRSASESSYELVCAVQAVSPRHREHLVARVTEEWKLLDTQNIESKIEELETIRGSQKLDSSSAMLSWSEVTTMASAGIEFGSHTKSHALLDQTSSNELRDEICSSKKIIETKLGVPVDFIAYPNGNYNDEVIALSQEAGYLGGFTCDVGFNTSSDRPFTMKRKHVLNELSRGLAGGFSNVFFATELSGIRQTVKEFSLVQALMEAGGQR